MIGAKSEEKEQEKDKSRNPFELGVKFLMTKAFSFMANKKAKWCNGPINCYG